MEKELNEIKFDLKKYGQEHLLNNFDKLDESKQKRLLEQLSNIDYELINGLYNGTKKVITEVLEQVSKNGIDSTLTKKNIKSLYKKYCIDQIEINEKMLEK